MRAEAALVWAGNPEIGFTRVPLPLLKFDLTCIAMMSCSARIEWLGG
jgi:hypothetical protein